jgi:hypothetical protein
MTKERNCSILLEYANFYLTSNLKLAKTFFSEALEKQNSKCASFDEKEMIDSLSLVLS